MSNTIHVDTPESVDVAFEPAGLGSRFLAALLDGLIQGAVAMVLLMVGMPVLFAMPMTGSFDLESVNGVLLAILLLLLGFLLLGYKLLLEAFWNGQTVGKRVAGIRVVQSSGLPAGFLQILVRNLMRVVDYLPMYYLIGSVSILASRHHQRLGDMVAGTLVVRERQASAPLLPQALSFRPDYDIMLLKERVLRLTEADLDAARGFWQRRFELEPKSRSRVAATVAADLAGKMAWSESNRATPEQFIELVLFLRARPV